MIELTSGYISATSNKFLINRNHIIYVSSCNQDKNPTYKGVNCYVEYLGSPEMQSAYVQETYEVIKELLK